MESAAYADMAMLEESHWWFAGRRRVVQAVLETHLPSRSARRVLDVGCGTGGMIKLLQHFGEVEAMESWPDAREVARQRHPGVRVHSGKLPDQVPQGAWDLISLFDVLEHLDDPVEALGVLQTRLTKGGVMVVTVPALQFLWSGHDDFSHHRRRYSRQLLKTQLEQAGFSVQYLSFFNTVLFPAVAAARILRRAMTTKSQNDLKPTPRLLNGLLERLLGFEGWSLRRISLPFGVSLVAVAVKGTP